MQAQDPLQIYSLPSSCGISLSPSSALIPHSQTSLTSAAHIFAHCPLIFRHRHTCTGSPDKDLLTWRKGAGSRCGTSSCYWPFWSVPSPASRCTGPAGPGWGPSLPFWSPGRPARSVGWQGRGVSLPLGWKAAGSRAARITKFLLCLWKVLTPN